MRAGVSVVTQAGSLFRNGLVELECPGQRRELPERGEADDDINQSRQRAAFAEYRRDQIEVEQADQSPVDAADDGQDQGCEIQGFHVRSPPLVVIWNWLQPK